MDIGRARSLFADLQQVDFDRPGRDPHHNLVDRLEIVAVATGLKPAFLGGQSGSVDTLLCEVAAVAEKHGLHTRRDTGLQAAAELLALASPEIDRGYLEYCLERDIKRDGDSKPALWVYADPQVVKLIEAGEQGRCLADRLLGYPTCCVLNLNGHLAERYAIRLKVFARDYQARTTEDLIKLERLGVGPGGVANRRIEEVDAQVSKELGESLVKFPFIHFTACPSCIHMSASPAAEIHAKMRNLAVTLDGGFVKKIEEYTAWYREVHEDSFGPLPWS